LADLPSHDAGEELAFIRKVIRDSRKAAAVDVTPFLVWSGVAVVGAALEYGTSWGGIPVPAVGLWLALIAGAWIYTIWERSRRRRESPATTLAERTLTALWVACWIGMTLLGFVGFMSGYLSRGGIFGAFAAVLGIGMFVSGLLLGETLVRLLAAAWWLASVAFFFWSGPHALALFALLILVLHLIPGIVLQRRWRGHDVAEPGPA
jgi:hypothetical protein